MKGFQTTLLILFAAVLSTQAIRHVHLYAIGYEEPIAVTAPGFPAEARAQVRLEDSTDDLMAEYNMQTRFPELSGTPGFTRDFVHYGNILALWSDLTGAESASNALAAAIDEGGRDAAIKKLVKAHAKGTDKYYFLEAEFNALGYRYLNEEKFDDAIAVFEMNVEMYPDSWNVYDSLGEVLMKSGRHDLAIRNYDRSLELNPENENGKRMLEEIQATLAKR